MLSGDIQLKERDRQTIDAAYRAFLEKGSRPQALPTGAVANLGTGRQRLNRLFTIAPAGRPTAAQKREAQAKPQADTRPATLGAASLAQSSRLARVRKAPQVRRMAEASLSRAAAARQMGISLGTLRRITREHGIRFARDRQEVAQ